MHEKIKNEIEMNDADMNALHRTEICSYSFSFEGFSLLLRTYDARHNLSEKINWKYFMWRDNSFLPCLPCVFVVIG